jgi:hypothetical protein
VLCLHQVNQKRLQFGAHGTQKSLGVKLHTLFTRLNVLVNVPQSLDKQRTKALCDLHAGFARLACDWLDVGCGCQDAKPRTWNPLLVVKR